VAWYGARRQAVNGTTLSIRWRIGTSGGGAVGCARSMKISFGVVRGFKLVSSISPRIGQHLDLQHAAAAAPGSAHRLPNVPLLRHRYLLHRSFATSRVASALNCGPSFLLYTSGVPPALPCYVRVPYAAGHYALYAAVILPLTFICSPFAVPRCLPLAACQALASRRFGGARVWLYATWYAHLLALALPLLA